MPSVSCVDRPIDRMAALQMIEPRAHAVTLGASKAYDTDFVNELRSMRVKPHSVAAANVDPAPIETP